MADILNFIDFFNSMGFEKQNGDVFELRRKSFFSNLRFTLCILILTTFLLFSYFLTGFKESHHDMSFPLLKEIPLNFVDYPWAYWFFFFTFFYSSFVSGFLSLQCDCLMASLMSFLSNEFNILAECLENSFDDINDENVNEKTKSLKKLVEYHQTLMQ
jgi:hypothetical protein